MIDLLLVLIIIFMVRAAAQVGRRKSREYRNRRMNLCS